MITITQTSHGPVYMRTAGEGEALVLLHQTASSSRMFDALIERLHGNFLCIAPDTPGYGHSPQCGDRTIAGLAEAIHEAVMGLGIEAYAVFGHHTGAAIGLQLAHTNPKHVNTLILSGPPLLTDSQKATLTEKLRPMQIQADGSHLHAVWDRIQARMPDDIPLNILHREVMDTLRAAEHYHHTYQAVFDQPVADQLTALTCPTLIMGGERDSLADSLATAHRLIPHSSYIVLEGAGTYYCDTHSDDVASIITRFLKE